MFFVPSLSALRLFFMLCLVIMLSSCASLITTTVIQPTVGNLQKQTDLDLVCEGAPAYLLMIDSMIASDPDSNDLLLIGAQSYSGYAAALAECAASPARIAAISGKAHLYGKGLISRMLPLGPDVLEGRFAKRLGQLNNSHVPRLFWGSLAWLTWIQQQQGSPAAMADLVLVEEIMARLLELDETYQAAGPHLFFGGYYGARPAMLGGSPDRSRHHFEQALAISDRNFLIIHTTYAKIYARQTFDRELHDKLLKEVLAFDIANAPDFALSNQIAKKIAQRLLAEDYFAE